MTVEQLNAQIHVLQTVRTKIVDKICENLRGSDRQGLEVARQIINEEIATIILKY